MKPPKATDVKKRIAALWETLQCPICLDLMTVPVSTKCDHQFCKFCMMKLLDNSKQNRANCPVCKSKITKRSLQESPGFQRLVIGLQDMIQAYQLDTGTNYFTGGSLQKRHSPVTHAENTEHPKNVSPRDTLGTEMDKVENVDLPQSHSSTVAAQNGFAILMELEDSIPLPTENEGLDSGLGDVPPTSEKKMSSPTENLEAETAGLVEEPTLQHQTKSKKSSRKKQKRNLEPEKIFEQKKKKSLEKVAEWLMKVPTEGEEELENPDGNAGDSDSCSSTSTLDIKLHNNEVISKREDRAKVLEEQVFGAVYKRRGKRTASPPLKVFVEPPTAVETETSESICKVRMDDSQTPTKEPMEEKNDNSSDIFKEVEQMEVEQENNTATNVEELNLLSESGKNNDLEVPCLDTVAKEQGKKAKKRSHNTMQLVDSDLQEQARAKSEANQNKAGRRKSKSTRSEKKAAKGPKPLVLVGVHNGETSPKVRERSEEVQVQIENYPSSEDPETPVIRSTRRSRRLKLFAEEVQLGHEKANSTARASKKHRTDEKLSAETKGETLDNSSPHKSGNMSSTTKRNGCVCDKDLGGIESMETNERKSPLRPAEAEVPHSETPSETAGACCLSVVPSSTNQSDASAVGPTLENDKSALQVQQEISAGEAECAGTENEEEKNDSELDTEQLLRSFKATKRKSFHLGEPKAKKSQKTHRGKVDGVEKNLMINETPDALKDTDNTSCSDLISPSTSPIQTRKTVFEKPGKAAVESGIPESRFSGQDSDAGKRFLGNSLSSGLSPNKVSKRDTSSPLSVVPQVVDSGIRFTAVEHGGLVEASKSSKVAESQLDSTTRGAGKLTEIRDCTSVDSPDIPAKCLVAATEHILNADSCLTPEGLVTPCVQVVHEAVTSSKGSGEVSSLSPVKSSKRAKRRAQKLESSSESDSNGSKEELPTLTQIFGTSIRPSAGNQGQEGPDAEMAIHPPACPSPDSVNSSQASVDLFGTPDECDVQVNGISVSVESSQFSNEVLVTQQKIEMKKELVRLEKLMALVSEVLQEKEGSPARQSPSETHNSSKTSGPDARRPAPSDPDLGQGSGSKEDPPPGPSDDKAVTESSLLRHDSITNNGLTAKCTGVSKTTNSTSAAKTLKSCVSPPEEQEDKENNSPPKDGRKAKFVLVTSGLGPNEQIMVKKFAKRVGAHVVSQVTPVVTHIIMRTDEQLVCERTLKYFLGIAGRKWVVSFQWISECFKQKKLLDESPFEVRGDVVNGPNHQGPFRARSTADSNLLMKGYTICFQGPFTDMTTDEMEWMVKLCGANVVKDPLLLDCKQKSCQLVIVQPRSDSSSSTYSSFSKKATVLTRGWLLDTVATYTMQNYNNYTI